jgi:hypothetical protein
MLVLRVLMMGAADMSHNSADVLCTVEAVLVI